MVHGDLKPANFVFVKGSLKLIDFGIAKAISNDTTNISRDSRVSGESGTTDNNNGDVSYSICILCPRRKQPCKRSECLLRCYVGKARAGTFASVLTYLSLPLFVVLRSRIFLVFFLAFCTRNPNPTSQLLSC